MMCECNCHPPKDFVMCPTHMCVECQKSRSDIHEDGCDCHCHELFKNNARELASRAKYDVKKETAKPSVVEELYPVHTLERISRTNPPDVMCTQDDIAANTRSIHKVGCMWCGNFYLDRCECGVCMGSASKFVMTVRYKSSTIETVYCGIRSMVYSPLNKPELVEEIEKCHCCLCPPDVSVGDGVPSPTNIHVPIIKELLNKFAQCGYEDTDRKVQILIDIMTYLARLDVSDSFQLHSRFKCVVLGRVCSFLNDIESYDRELWVHARPVFKTVLESYRLTIHDHHRLLHM